MSNFLLVLSQTHANLRLIIYHLLVSFEWKNGRRPVMHSKTSVPNDQ